VGLTPEQRLTTVLDALSDETLVRDAQDGDTAALGLLIAWHRAVIRAMVLSMLGTGPDADDAVQDASLIALRHIGSVRDPAAGDMSRPAQRPHGPPGRNNPLAAHRLPRILTLPAGHPAIQDNPDVPRERASDGLPRARHPV
jgi:hypothetical protein